MPTNKKKTKSGKTKAMKREGKGLPPFSAPNALCFPPARPKGCTDPMYVHSKPLGGYLIYGCHCPLTSTTCCCDKLPPNDKSPLTPFAGYTNISGRCPHNVLENAKFYRRTLGLELRAKVGVCGFADTNGRDVHIVYGCRILEGKPWANGRESFHTWLEDSNGLIYDHVSSHSIELGYMCGADTSRVTNNQRFVGVSREEIHSNFGFWYESHSAGDNMRDKLNAEIGMGFTEPWPRGTLDSWEQV
ncbi:unnamed protein product [Ectocarpus sp. 12 AP-2014]